MYEGESRMSCCLFVPQLLQSYDTVVSTARARRRFTAAFKLKILEAAARVAAAPATVPAPRMAPPRALQGAER